MPEHTLPDHDPPPTANDRLKRRYDTALRAGLVAAAVLHVFLIGYVPSLGFDLASPTERTLRLSAPPAIVEPSPPPPSPRRPPAIAGVGDEFEEVVSPPPPTPPRPVDPPIHSAIPEQPTFTPYEVAPTLKNYEEAVKALETYYPSDRYEAGIGARVQIWFYIDEHGMVQRTVLKESSGHSDIDDAVLEAAAVMRFSPALSGDRRVPVWIALPVVFEIDTPVAEPMVEDTSSRRGDV